MKVQNLDYVAYRKTLNPDLQKQLIKTAKEGDIDGMISLMKAGADPFETDWLGNSAISYAIRSNKEEIPKIVRSVLDFSYKRGRVVNNKDKDLIL